MHNEPVPRIHHPEPAKVVSALRKRSFATFATTSPAGRPHVAGVLYEIVGAHLWVNTLRTSRKARNVAAGGRAAVSIPVRRLPVGPPSSVQFQADAEILAVDEPAVTAALSAGHLSSLTGHGELDLPGTCFIRVALPDRVLTYGLGMSLWSLIRDPLTASGEARVEAWS